MGVIICFPSAGLPSLLSLRIPLSVLASALPARAAPVRPAAERIVANLAANFRRVNVAKFMVFPCLCCWCDVVGVYGSIGTASTRRGASFRQLRIEGWRGGV